MIKPRIAVIGAALVAAACVVVVVGAAQVAVATDVEEMDGSHCVYRVVDQKQDGEFVMGAVRCFDTFSAATEYATSGKIRLPADMGAEAYTASPIVTAASFTLGIHYDGVRGTGTSVTVVGSSCGGGYWNTPSWFDNRISSSYSGCHKLVHYDRANMSGSSYTTYGRYTTHDLSWFSNRTESVQYLP